MIGSVRLRVFTEPQQGADYATLLKVAKTAEDLGFDAFFRSDHYLKTGEGSGLPGPTDAWITLAGLARDTSTIRWRELRTGKNTGEVHREGCWLRQAPASQRLRT